MAMKKCVLSFVLVLVTMSLVAAPVDLTAARIAAQSFVNNYGGSAQIRINASGESLRLLHSEMSKVNPQQPVYYIFTTRDSYVIVSGDDRAVDVLAYGDYCLDINNIPLGMKDMLNQYKDAIEFLQKNPSLKVKPVVSPLNTPSLKAISVGPLLTADWDQEAPYNNQCKFGNYQCLTGCPATSAAMVFYYWKYPTEPTPVIPGYDFRLRYPYGSKYVHLDSLPSITFDWDNMLDSYSGDYTDEQANAVSTLMRYVGQAERMNYGTRSMGSGVSSDSISLIADAFTLMGYDPTTIQVVKKTSDYNGGETLYTDDEWAELIQGEILAERPIILCAIDDNGGGGHAFNVDGYNSSTNKYHINFGWSGYGNDWCALNAFGCDSENFNVYQQAVIGIQPSAVGDPVIHADCTSMDFGVGYNGYSEYRTFTVTTENIRQSITLSLSGIDAGDFFIDGNSTITPAQAAQGAKVTIGFFPLHEGTLSAVLTLTSPGADDVVIPVTGYGIKTGAFIEPSDTALSFETAVGKPVSLQLGVLKRDFDDVLGKGLIPDSLVQVLPVSASVEGDDCFVVISSAKATTAQGNDSIIFTIQYYPLMAGNHQAQLVLRSMTPAHQAHPVMVALSGFAILLGDMDGDGVLTMDDFFILKTALIDNDDEVLCNPNADVNGDGMVGIKDLVILVDLVRNSSDLED